MGNKFDHSHSKAVVKQAAPRFLQLKGARTTRRPRPGNKHFYFSHINISDRRKISAMEARPMTRVIMVCER